MKTLLFASLAVTTVTAQETTTPSYPTSRPDHITGYSEIGNTYQVDHSSGATESGIITGDKDSSIRVVLPDSGNGGGFIFQSGGYTRYFGN